MERELVKNRLSERLGELIALITLAVDNICSYAAEIRKQIVQVDAKQS
jgi:hypothetical protein